MHYCANDLRDDEATQAYILLELGTSTPEQVIQRFRGPQATLLDPSQFSRGIQSRVQELMAQKRRGVA